MPELLARGHSVVATDIPPSAPWAPDYTPCDLCDAAAVEALVAERRPDACIHLAGVSFIPDAARDPGRLYAVNIGGTLNVLEALARHAAGARMLFVSTAQVYGCTFNPDDAPVNEDAPLYPLSPYAISKVAGESAARAYGAMRGLRVRIVRPSNHTGPGQSPKFVVPSFVEQAKAVKRGERDHFTAGNLASGRDFSDVRDIVAAYCDILEKGTDGATYNAGSDRRVTIADLFGEIQKAAGVDAPVESDPALVRPTDFSHKLDTSRLRALGWRPAHTLAETLGDMLA